LSFLRERNLKEREMAKTYTEIGELRANEDGSLYLKVYINKKNGSAVTINSGDTIRLDDPKLKYDRMIESGRVDDVDKLIEERDNIPSYVKRRATLVQGK
jgi:hypothetical protein